MFVVREGAPWDTPRTLVKLLWDPTSGQPGSWTIRLIKAFPEYSIAVVRMQAQHVPCTRPELSPRQEQLQRVATTQYACTADAQQTQPDLLFSPRDNRNITKGRHTMFRRSDWLIYKYVEYSTFSHDNVAMFSYERGARLPLTVAVCRNYLR